MRTVAEIEEVLLTLSIEDLMRVEAALRGVQRQRYMGIIFDDAYGIWTEDDQTAVGAEAWQVMDGAPEARING